MCFRTEKKRTCFLLPFAAFCSKLLRVASRIRQEFGKLFIAVGSGYVIGQVSLGYGLSGLIGEVAAWFHPLMEYPDDLN
jgi:hypothetical protein